MTRDQVSVEEVLHAKLEVQTSMDFIPIISNPINGPINAPTLVEEVIGVQNLTPNQIPTSELFEIPIKGR